MICYHQWCKASCKVTSGAIKSHYLCKTWKQKWQNLQKPFEWWLLMGSTILKMRSSAHIKFFTNKTIFILSYIFCLVFICRKFLWWYSCFRILCSFLLHSKVNQINIYISHCFLDFFPIYVITEQWAEFPVLSGRFSLVICFTQSISGVCIKCNLPIQPHSPSSLGVFVFLYVCISISALWLRSSKIPDICIKMPCIYFSLCDSLQKKQNVIQHIKQKIYIFFCPLQGQILSITYSCYLKYLKKCSA